MSEFNSQDLDLAASYDDLVKQIETLEGRSLEYVNLAGMVEFVASLRDVGLEEGVDFHLLDITSDGIPDLVFHIGRNLYVLACIEGQYQYGMKMDAGPFSDFWWEVQAIEDMNNNGVLDLIVRFQSCQGGSCLDVYIFEWDGTELRSIIRGKRVVYGQLTDDVTGYASLSGSQHVEVEDLDDDGLLELVLRGDIPSNIDRIIYGPWRETTYIYAWDGSVFSLADWEYSSPQFRFQASQDADRAVLEGEYDRAYELYDAVINEKGLDWWSRERFLHLEASYVAGLHIPGRTTPEPTLTPVVLDEAEYQILAAYSYFRLIVLDTLLGKDDLAEERYQELQGICGDDGVCAPYLDMATEYWFEYASSQDVGRGCKAVVAFATANPGMLTPLGSDYHGWNSIAYEPQDVCPFP